MAGRTMEDVTTASAVGAITSPWWLPTLHDISTTAAEWAPILGCIWLVTQIFFHVRKNVRRGD